MKLFLGLVAAIIVTPAYAQTVSDGELNSALAACEQGHEKAVRRSDVPTDYKGPEGPLLVRKFESGWEHCVALRKEKEAREDADRRARASHVTDDRGLSVQSKETDLPPDVVEKAASAHRESERKSSEDVARRLGTGK